jgi:hypothetical protein
MRGYKIGKKSLFTKVFARLPGEKHILDKYNKKIAIAPVLYFIFAANEAPT